MISPPNIEAESNPLHPIRVLLIEDNPEDARLIQKMLMPLQAIRSDRAPFDLQWANELAKGIHNRPAWQFRGAWPIRWLGGDDKAAALKTHVRIRVAEIQCCWINAGLHGTDTSDQIVQT